MIERFVQNKLRWINLKNPTAAEIKSAVAELGIPFILAQDLATPVPKNSAAECDSFIKVVFDFPTVKSIDAQHPNEVKFIFSKKNILSVQYEEMEGIDRFKRQFEVATTLRKNQKGITAAHLFMSLMNHLYDSASTKLDYVESKLEDIESEIFKNNEKKMVVDISEVSKKLINFRHVMSGHEDVFQEASPLFESVYKNSFDADLQSIRLHYDTLCRRTNSLFETLVALRETNTAMLTTRQNEIIKNLTLMAFITFPLTLLSSIFGMNVESAPIIGKAGDFWIIVAIMIFGAVCFFFFFKRKGWL